MSDCQFARLDHRQAWRGYGKHEGWIWGEAHRARTGSMLLPNLAFAGALAVMNALVPFEVARLREGLLAPGHITRVRALATVDELVSPEVARISVGLVAPGHITRVWALAAVGDPVML